MLMKPGAKWQLFVPPELGLRRESADPEFPANSLLIFDVEVAERQAERCGRRTAPPRSTAGEP